MNRGIARWSLLILFLLAGMIHCPAPLIYTPGEGWSYESVGEVGKWKRDRAKEQLIVAQDAFDKEEYKLALKAAKRTVNQWPLSDYAPQAQDVVAKSYDAKGDPQRAFKEFQKLIDRYPMRVDYEEVAARQYDIAGQFLAGRWFKFLGIIPYPPSMDKVAGMYKTIVVNGPFSKIAPEAQLKMGEAREKQKDFAAAVKVYETAADRYHDKPKVAAEALFKAGMAYNKQTRKAEYDQSLSHQAINTLGDFILLYPNDARVPKAEMVIAELKAEEAHGSYKIARFYEERHKWRGALIYYNEVLRQDPDSPYAAEARERIEALKDNVRNASS